jgi:hypothetical protein
MSECKGSRLWIESDDGEVIMIDTGEVVMVSAKPLAGATHYAPGGRTERAPQMFTLIVWLRSGVMEQIKTSQAGRDVVLRALGREVAP